MNTRVVVKMYKKIAVNVKEKGGWENSSLWMKGEIKVYIGDAHKKTYPFVVAGGCSVGGRDDVFEADGFEHHMYTMKDVSVKGGFFEKIDGFINAFVQKPERKYLKGEVVLSEAAWNSLVKDVIGEMGGPSVVKERGYGSRKPTPIECDLAFLDSLQQGFFSSLQPIRQQGSRPQERGYGDRQSGYGGGRRVGFHQSGHGGYQPRRQGSQPQVREYGGRRRQPGDSDSCQPGYGGSYQPGW